jgi:hypothetical protein
LAEAVDSGIDDLIIGRPKRREERRQAAQDTIVRDTRERRVIEMLRRDEESKRARAVAEQNGEDVSKWYTLGDRVPITYSYAGSEGQYLKAGSVGTIEGIGDLNCLVEFDSRVISVPREHMGGIVTPSGSLREEAGLPG